MKVSLVVATGAHEGRVIPITGPQFLIGRDEQCQLRPASQAISKMHCGVLIRDGKVFVKDYGSTNGTTVNKVLVQNGEVGVEDGASIQVGPLDFRLKVERVAPKLDGTPLPGGSVEAAALAAVKAATAVAVAAKAPPRDTTPNPVRTGSAAAPAAKAPGSGSQPGVKAPTKPGSKEAPALKADSKESPAVTTTSEATSEEDHDRIAAMLLGMDETGNSAVPDGSTVMDMPSPLAGGGEAAKAGEKKDDKPKLAQTREEMSSAANDLLRKYMRRPK
ncbi:FHA domain-containing protein [Frigoriglobus tundricola]|uniref:FHA domain-containing protein n=1 Tax=Frigoriglobus tundricola TaxID=2774151 RepID=A0A6M5YRY8_9BACT|nr:FHA domain-containing protein [Frigoriglobus tundricola]QJW95742.1 hypothetical protein FTUN_3296 [Frigoriglobus tundricola]